jgi:dihydroorotate dehydrogenase
LKSIYDLFKKIAFAIDPEKIHESTLNLLSRYPHFFSLICPSTESEKYTIQIGRLSWKFPVGLAAGLDKNATAIDFFSRILFGSIEVGTVTPAPQKGNPRPRLFRYLKEESLRNRMGFNNLGWEGVLRNILSSTWNGKILGVNLGKNRQTTEEDAYKDYCLLYEKFCKVADYLVINVSSPNTPGLRDLQRKENLKSIFQHLEGPRRKNNCPLYLKISPDIPDNEIDPIIDLVKEFELEGIIATNTTVIPEYGDGGISGKLCLARSRAMRKKILEKVRECPKIQVIGVGGIGHFGDLLDFWRMGGKAVQIYTSLIYHGPWILRDFQTGIDECLNKTGCKNLEELLRNIHKI